MAEEDVRHRLTAEVGCLLDEHNGQVENDRDVTVWASRCSWESEPMVVESDEWADAVEEAVEYLNDHVARDGYSFGWYEGNFFYQSEEWWDA
jgi:hypothetical protein